MTEGWAASKWRPTRRMLPLTKGTNTEKITDREKVDTKSFWNCNSSVFYSKKVPLKKNSYLNPLRRELLLLCIKNQNFWLFCGWTGILNVRFIKLHWTACHAITSIVFSRAWKKFPLEPKVLWSTVTYLEKNLIYCTSGTMVALNVTTVSGITLLRLQESATAEAGLGHDENKQMPVANGEVWLFCTSQIEGLYCNWPVF